MCPNKAKKATNVLVIRAVTGIWVECAQIIKLAYSQKSYEKVHVQYLYLNANVHSRSGSTFHPVAYVFTWASYNDPIRTEKACVLAAMPLFPQYVDAALFNDISQEITSTEF